MTDYERLLLEAIAEKLGLPLAAIREEAERLEEEHKAEIRAFYGMPEPEITMLACGCPVGTHENSMEAMKIAHPDFLWPNTQMFARPFYGIEVPTLAEVTVG